ncbi:hypothetical protein RKD55_004617 [Rossellomorea marisflavi]
MPELSFLWLNVAIFFLVGLVITMSSYRQDGFLGDDDIGKILGIFLMAMQVFVGVQLYVDPDQFTKDDEENKTQTEQKEALESVEMDRRIDLIAEKLNVESTEVIVYPTGNGLFNAETSEGKYLVEFSDSYEGINKIIKTER